MYIGYTKVYKASLILYSRTSFSLHQLTSLLLATRTCFALTTNLNSQAVPTKLASLIIFFWRLLCFISFRHSKKTWSQFFSSWRFPFQLSPSISPGLSHWGKKNIKTGKKEKKQSHATEASKVIPIGLADGAQTMGKFNGGKHLQIKDQTVNSPKSVFFFLIYTKNHKV